MSITITINAQPSRPRTTLARMPFKSFGVITDRMYRGCIVFKLTHKIAVAFDPARKVIDHWSDTTGNNLEVELLPPGFSFTITVTNEDA